MHNLDIMLVFKIVLPYYVDMYVARASWPSSNGKSYQSIHLRESYRDGEHVRKRDIANLTHCDPKEIAAIELALQFKGNLAALGSLDKVQLSQGLSLGAVWTVAKPPGVSALTKPSAPDSPPNWRYGRCWPACWSRVRVCPPCAWRKSMRPAMCSASNGASTRTISTPTSLG